VAQAVSPALRGPEGRLAVRPAVPPPCAYSCISDRSFLNRDLISSVASVIWFVS
jgi:hypothetical protein